MNFKFEVNGEVSLSLQPQQDTHKFLLEKMLESSTNGQVFQLVKGDDGQYRFKVAKVGTEGTTR